MPQPVTAGRARRSLPSNFSHPQARQSPGQFGAECNRSWPDFLLEFWPVYPALRCEQWAEKAIAQNPIHQFLT